MSTDYKGNFTSVTMNGAGDSIADWSNCSQHKTLIVGNDFLKRFAISAICTVVIASLALLLLSTYDDAYLKHCADNRYGTLPCLLDYFILWVLPYWWVLLLAAGITVGLLIASISRFKLF